MFGYCVQRGLVEEVMLDLTPPMMTEELRHLHTRKKDSSSRRQSRNSVKEEEFCRIQDTADGKKERKE